MRLTTLDRELARLAPTPGPDALDAIRTRVMAEITDGRHAAPTDPDAPTAVTTPTDTPPAPTDADVLPLPRRTTRSRRVAVRLGIAASLAAASVAGVTLWPDPSASWVPAAYAGWRAVPEPVTPVDAQAHAQTCLAKVAFLASQGDTSYAALPLADMTPVVAERRGPWTYTLLAAGGPGSHADAGLTCLLSDDPTVGGSISAWSGSTAAPPARGQIQWISAGWGGEIFDIQGYVGDDVSRVTATLWNGVVVDATVADGRFVAWWPVLTGRTTTADPFTLTWYLADGTRGGTYGWTAP
jgi:hypothetical protein